MDDHKGESARSQSASQNKPTYQDAQGYIVVIVFFFLWGGKVAYERRKAWKLEGGRVGEREASQSLKKD